MPLDELTTVDDYLARFGSTLAARLTAALPPRFDPERDAPHPATAELLRRPLRAQADCITALYRAFQHHRGLVLVGEMGTGKTLIAAGTLHVLHPGPFRALVLCPPHLTRKWRRELDTTIPGVVVRPISRLGDCLALAARGPARTAREVWLLSRERAKLGPAWRAAYLTSRRQPDLARCPRCGARQLGQPSQAPIPLERFARERRACVACGEPLWQTDPAGPRRFAPATWIHRHLKGWFDLLIADEAHELKGAATAQGHALGRLAAAARRTLLLTGTLTGGYASHVHRLLGRVAMPALQAEGMGWHDQARWSDTYGLVERVETVRRLATGQRQRTSHRLERPGISPRIFSRYLLPLAAFIDLADLCLDLPPYQEEARLIDMDAQLALAYRGLAQALESSIGRALRRRAWGLLGSFVHTLLAYPDHPGGFEPIRHPTRPDRVLARPADLPLDRPWAKDRALVDLIEHERAQGRRVCVYAHHTGARDVVGRLRGLLERHGIRAAALRADVPAEQREAWLARASAQDLDALVVNPALVTTGLDLIDWPTIVWYETGLSLYQLRQASRRAWRIGQRRACRVVFLAYRNTVQAAALSLMGTKMLAALAVEGKLAADGLTALADSWDLTVELARAVAGALGALPSAERVWRELSPTPPEPPAPGPAPAPADIAAPVSAEPPAPAPCRRRGRHPCQPPRGTHQLALWDALT
jgi:hypothetical protein